MKPCRSCIMDYGRAICTHLGCCVFDEIYELPDKKAETRFQPAPSHPKEEVMIIVKTGQDH